MLLCAKIGCSCITGSGRVQSLHNTGMPENAWVMECLSDGMGSPVKVELEWPA